MNELLYVDIKREVTASVDILSMTNRIEEVIEEYSIENSDYGTDDLTSYSNSEKAKVIRAVAKTLLKRYGED